MRSPRALPDRRLSTQTWKVTLARTLRAEVPLLLMTNVHFIESGGDRLSLKFLA